MRWSEPRAPFSLQVSRFAITDGRAAALPKDIVEVRIGTVYLLEKAPWGESLEVAGDAAAVLTFTNQGTKACKEAEPRVNSSWQSADRRATFTRQFLSLGDELYGF